MKLTIKTITTNQPPYTREIESDKITDIIESQKNKLKAFATIISIEITGGGEKIIIER